MATALLWVWDKDNGKWVELQSDSEGKLRIATLDDAEISQDTPEDLKHVPHGYYAAGPSYLPLAVDANGKLLIKGPALDHLNDIEDVDVASPSDKMIVYWDNATSLWKCQLLSSWALSELGTKVLDNLDNLDVGSPSDGQLIRWDAGNSKWQKILSPFVNAVGSVISQTTSLGFYTKDSQYTDILIYSHSGASYVLNLQATQGKLWLFYPVLYNALDANSQKINNLDDPTAAQDADTKAARDAAIATIDHTSIQDADVDTKVDTEESADEDIIRMDVAGVEAFNLDNLGRLDLATQSGARAYLTGGVQSIPSGSYTKAQLNGESYDTQNEYDATTNYRYTAGKAGTYAVSAGIYIGTGAAPMKDGCVVGAAIFKNGSWLTMAQQIQGAAAPTFIAASWLVKLAANDYLELYVCHFHGANRDLRDDSDGFQYTHLEIQKIA